MQFRAMAATRLVAEIAMGNSQQMKDGYGWDYGWPYAMNQFVPIYATSVFPRGAESAAGYNASYGQPSNDGTRPSQFDPLLLPGQKDPAPGPLDAGFGYQETGDPGDGARLFATGGGADGLDHRHRLRLHFAYGTFPSGSGTLRPQIRMEASPYTQIAQSPVINTNTGAYGITRGTLDLPADPARTYALGARWRATGSTLTAPALQSWMQLEDRDVAVGYCLTSMFAEGGQTIEGMAAYIANMADAQLRNMITACVQIQLDRGLVPMAIFAIHEGENARNMTDSSAVNYVAQFRIIWERFKYGWEKLCGFPLANLACEVRCGVPISFPQDVKMAAYDAAMARYSLTDPMVSHFRYEDSTSYQSMVDSGLFLDGLHLTPLGYQVLALNDLTRNMPKVPAINKDLPGIGGVRGLGRTLTVIPGTWFQSPTLTYQWFADGIPIAGATGSTFVETSAEAGKALMVVETATIAGLRATATSPELLDFTSLVANYQSGTYILGSTTYADETSFNTAAGITKSGITRVSTPAIIGPELIVNGTFDTDTSGWTAQATVSIAAVSGKMRVTRPSAGQTQYAYYGVPAEIGKAYVAKFDSYSVSGNMADCRWGNSAGNNLYFNTAVPVVGSVQHIPSRATALFFAAGDANAARSGVSDVDNISAREEAPFPTYSGIAHTVYIEAVTAGTLPSGAHQVLYQEDISAESNRRRIVWETDGHIWVRYTVNNTDVAALDLGAVAASTAIRIATAYDQNDFAASLNGGAAVTDTAGNCPAAAFLRIGRSFTGETWAGSINLVHHRNTRLSNANLVLLTS
ncbi:hypothetical protein OSH08_01025 [Kaistia geumhonensis]|uniref:SGNH/GDSL hydrolase family protein n=1 Tax=Kaistia geumhonensis TaxID=410839 RepID=A0ABU0M8D8_9HYPH|nr:hypothetical protein [Kaistia geumhonensis]MCX5477566.1 hypothetical protein [Kaistia geumhonensis]MDQ0517227.1 hypothetical protein [Kaistia geumhonensis]